MRTAVLIATLAAAALTAHAAAPAIPASGMPTASEYSALVLEERAGVVSWKTLGAVEMVQQGIRLVPNFAPGVRALDNQEVMVQGFMIPIEVGATHKRFFISGVPPECPFCLPAGPEALIEVAARSAIKPSSQPIILTGRLSLMKDSPDGLLYRLTDAVSKGYARTTAAIAHQ